MTNPIKDGKNWCTLWRSKKHKNNLRHPVSSPEISIFLQKSAIFVISVDEDEHSILIQNLKLF